jgi:hypothetical protein
LFALHSLKNRKAPGIDGVPAEFYKHAVDNIHFRAAWLAAFNSLFQMGEYYSHWETSIMHTIFKFKGEKNSPDNYRGIALAPILSKVYSKLLYTRLQRWALAHNKITHLQAGFRPGYCTVDNIFVLDHLVKKYLSRRNGRLYCAFIDFQKAFDTVNRQKLWARLWELGCSTKMLEALIGMYKNVRFAIKCGQNEVTSPIQSYQGVKQGCILSPLLFVLFINNVFDNMFDNTDIPRVGEFDEMKIPGLLYADDLMLCSLTISGLQNLLNHLESFCDMAGLSVHIGKTNIICYKNSPSLSRTETCKYKGLPIQTVRSLTYLGMCISMSGKWTAHINKAVVKAKKAGAAASSILFKCIDPPLQLCNQLYSSHVESVALYGADIWGLDRTDALNSVQSSFYKRVLGLARSVAHCGILRETGVIDIKSAAQCRALMYWLRCAKDLAPPLVACCYREQLRQGNTWVQRPWVMKVKDFLSQMSLAPLWHGEGLNEANIYSRLKSELYTRTITRTIFECSAMKSLILSQTNKWGVPPYMTLCNREQRSSLMWFWLGGFLTNKHTLYRNGTRFISCPLCKEKETARHILLECSATLTLRNAIEHSLRQFSVNQLRCTDDASFLKLFGTYMSKVRCDRNEALDKIRSQRVTQHSS